ncbi:MAG: cysteine desulfurase [Oscillospiraceae bacterium]|nr:cysteine desulfurase [Oscillospiraceae bacterium]
MEKRFVYADNGASAPVSDRVLNAMLPFFKEQYGNPSAVHSQGREVRRAVENSRKVIAECLNCLPSEVIFTSGGTESDNTAILSVLKLGRGHIITTAVEHKAVLEPCRELERCGFRVTYLKPDSSGMISAEQVRNAFEDDTVMVSIMTANNEVGTLLPIKDIGRLCREKGVIFHTDAVQAVGKVKIDVKEMCIDMLSVSGHKINAPKGIGALYIRDGAGFSPHIYGGGQEKGRRSGTENVPGIVALGEAVKAACEDMEKKCGYVSGLRDKLIAGLEGLGGRLNGGRENRLCGNASVSFEGYESETLLLMLDMRGVCASGGSACSSGTGKISHVLEALGMSEERARGTLRFTLAEENTWKDVDYIISSMEDCLTRLKRLKEV